MFFPLKLCNDTVTNFYCYFHCIFFLSNCAMTLSQIFYSDFYLFFSMAYVDEKIEEFLQEMKDILANMTQDEFDKLVCHFLVQLDMSTFVITYF